MSSFDHKTLMALRLGPWAGLGTPPRTGTDREIEAALAEALQAPPKAEADTKRGRPRPWALPRRVLRG